MKTMKERRTFVRGRKPDKEGKSGEIIAAINGDSGVAKAKNRRLASGLSAIRPSMEDQLIFLPLSFFSPSSL